MYDSHRGEKNGGRYTTVAYDLRSPGRISHTEVQHNRSSILILLNSLGSDSSGSEAGGIIASEGTSE